MDRSMDHTPAFPTSIEHRYYCMGEKVGTRLHPGMGLRDYFAAKVLQGFMVRADGVNDLDDDYLLEAARTCYRVADAMMAARQKEAS